MLFDVQEFPGGVMATFASKRSQPEFGTPQVTLQVEQLLAVIQGGMTRQELMAVLGLKDRKHFADAYLKPAQVKGKIKKLLLEKGYIVHGIKRRSSSFNTQRVDHIYQDPHVDNARFKLHYGDLSDSSNLRPYRNML